MSLNEVRSMTGSRPLFVTSLARSGGGLHALMLNVNQNVLTANEPYMELFRSLRNALVRANAPSDLARTFEPASPMQDYYFTDDRIAIMDAVQAGDLETPFDAAEWPVLLAKSEQRAALDAADLIPQMRELKGATYKEMFDNALRIIATTRGAENRRWVGIKEGWIVELFRPLARAYPDARFMILLRDPRATINSMLGMKGSDRELIAHTLSYARHWRKYLAFALHYLQDPLFAGRLYVLTHEQLLADPDRKAREMCTFLEVPFDPAMLDTANYFDYGAGRPWKGNSSFETETSGISTHRAVRWRTMLDPKAIRMVDFVCGPDLIAAGYPTDDEGTRWPSPQVLQWIIDDHEKPNYWRSDLGDPQQDYGYELFRRALLTLEQDPVDAGLVRRSFLFEDVFRMLHSAKRHASFDPARLPAPS